MDKPTRRMSEYALGLEYRSLTRSSIDATVRHFLDSIGCALGAQRSRPVTIARKIAATATISEGTSVLGLASKTTPEYAAFANTVMIRYLDYNDTGIGGHPSDMIPPILALAELRQSTGKELVKAVFAAYEVVAALRRGGFRLRDKHVDQMQSIVGGVVGAGMILGLDQKAMGNAISLAITPNTPLRVVRTGHLSDWKGCATAHCSMMAVFAARLAKEGMTGPGEPFEGVAGFYDLLNVGPFDLDDIGSLRDGLSAVEQTGLKCFPSEYSSQGPLGTILDIRRQLEIEDVDRITVALHRDGWHEIGGGKGDREEKWNPTTRETADHSLPYLIAVALLDGEVTIDSFAEERISDPAIRDVMRRIDVVESAELTREHAGELPRWPSVTEVVLNNGQTIRQHSGIPRGHPLNPMSDQEIEEKFIALSSDVLSDPAARDLMDCIWNLEMLGDIGELTEHFRFELPSSR